MPSDATHDLEAVASLVDSSVILSLPSGLHSFLYDVPLSPVIQVSYYTTGRCIRLIMGAPRSIKMTKRVSNGSRIHPPVVKCETFQLIRYHLPREMLTLLE